MRRVAHRELPEQMLPLVLKLPVRDGNGFDGACRAHLGAVKRVAAQQGFVMNSAQVRVDGISRRGVGSESLKLRMTAIALSLASKHRSSKQRLTPESDKPLRIEITRMNRPQPHGCPAVCDD